jgi:uncharacterized protein YndB with AHSA1/START domain
MTTFKTQITLLATPEQVFDAIRSPERLARWWGPHGFSNEVSVCDFKNGGQWSFVMVGPDGRRYPNENIFLEIEVNRKVVIQHVSEPKFKLTIVLETRPALSSERQKEMTCVLWEQTFEDSNVAKQVESIVVPANDQNLERLQAEVMN